MDRTFFRSRNDMRFSIITPVYNRPQEVEELLESLSQQRFKDFELVLVEDGSTEPSREVVERYANAVRVQYHFKRKEGPSPARNFGFAQAQGEYLILFDSDLIHGGRADHDEEGLALLNVKDVVRLKYAPDLGVGCLHVLGLAQVHDVAQHNAHRDAVDSPVRVPIHMRDGFLPLSLRLGVRQAPSHEQKQDG